MDTLIILDDTLMMMMMMIMMMIMMMMMMYLFYYYFVVTLNDKVSEYKVKVKDGAKDLDETIKIDTKKGTETFHIPSNGDTSPDAPGEVDVVYDFKQVRKLKFGMAYVKNSLIFVSFTFSFPFPSFFPSSFFRSIFPSLSSLQNDGCFNCSLSLYLSLYLCDFAH